MDTNKSYKKHIYRLFKIRLSKIIKKRKNGEKNNTWNISIETPFYNFEGKKIITKLEIPDNIIEKMQNNKEEISLIAQSLTKRTINDYIKRIQR